MQQIGTVVSYQRKFESLRPLVEAENLDFKEDYFIKCFVGGLKDEIRGLVQLLNPTTLTKAIAFARVQEATIEAINRKSRLSNIVPRTQDPVTAVPNPSLPSTSRHPTHTTQNMYSVNTSQPTNTRTSPNNPYKKLTYAEIQDKRNKGLCYKRDEAYKPGHQCKNKEVFIMLGEEEEELDGVEEPGGVEISNEALIEQAEIADLPEMGISQHALNGNTTDTTLRITATVEGQEVSTN